MYLELRAHTAFSFGDGVLTPEALVARAADLGYPALGLTDHADLGGLIRFALAAERHGIKPIAGAALNVDGHPTAFLARNQRGYRNLATLVTRARMGELRGWGAGELRVARRAGAWAIRVWQRKSEPARRAGQHDEPPRRRPRRRRRSTRSRFRSGGGRC